MRKKLKKEILKNGPGSTIEKGIFQPLFTQAKKI
jgi:hypothetical protein